MHPDQDWLKVLRNDDTLTSQQNIKAGSRSLEVLGSPTAAASKLECELCSYSYQRGTRRPKAPSILHLHWLGMFLEAQGRA